MKVRYTIDTSSYGARGVRHVRAVIRKIRKRYPQISENAAMWCLAACAAYACDDALWEDFLPAYAEASGYTANSAISPK